MPSFTGFVPGGSSGGGSSSSSSGITGPTSLQQVILPLSHYSVGPELLFGQQFQGGTAATWPVANQGVWVPFWVPCSFTAKVLWCENSATVAGNTDMGIYNANLSRLVSIGPTAMSGANSIQFFDIADTTLTAGTQYYLAFSHSEGTATFGNFPASSVIQMAATGCFTQTAVGTLPDPAVPATPANTNIPLMGLSSNTSF